jgi:hypothetical protein
MTARFRYMTAGFPNNACWIHLDDCQISITKKSLKYRKKPQKPILNSQNPEKPAKKTLKKPKKAITKK